MRILLVCNSYPPHVSPRSIRWSAIAEHWARRGDDVHLVCGWTPGAPRSECLNGVHVHRVGGGFSERLRSKLGGETKPAPGTTSTAGAPRGLKSRIRSAAKGGFRLLHDSVWKNLYWPDYACLWSLAATRQVRTLLRQHEFDVFVTTSLPFSDHVVGLRTIRKFRELPWLVDVGDPFSFLDDTPTNNHRLYRGLNRRVERRVFRRGDAISVTNENTRRIYADLFPEAAARVEVIPPLLRDGVADSDDAATVFPDDDRLRVSFIGTLHPKIRTPEWVLALFRELWKSDEGERLELHFFGPANHCEPFFDEFRDLQNRQLFLHGPVPHATARRVMSETDVLLNIGNATTYQLPSKIVEYASTGKPILNVTTVDGDSSAACLQDYAQAVSVRLAAAEDIHSQSVATVASFLRDARQLDRQAVDDWCRPYRIEAVIDRYDELISAARKRHGWKPPAGTTTEQRPPAACAVRLHQPADDVASPACVPRVVSITGSTGFIGGRLVDAFSRRGDVALRLLTRDRAKLADETRSFQSPPEVLEGDLLNPESIGELPVAGGTVINTVYLAGRSLEDNVDAAANLAEAAAAAGIKRMIHCSTAVVVGRPEGSRVDESTPCRPQNEYETTKLAVEEELTRRAAGRFELAILRPTAVFGPGGQNLLKLANDLRHGRRVVNYLKSCLFNRRRMNAVCVANVVSAIEFLVDVEAPLTGDVFLISDDDQPGNTYRDIEKRLQQELGTPDYRFPRIPLPRFALSTCLRLVGKSNTNPDCRYDAGKIIDAGFHKPATLEDGLHEFADWYKAA